MKSINPQRLWPGMLGLVLSILFLQDAMHTTKLQPWTQPRASRIGNGVPKWFV